MVTAEPSGSWHRSPEWWIRGADWRLRADWVLSDSPGWRALVGVRRDLGLLVTAQQDAPGTLEVEAWAGEPGESDGVAVVGEEGGTWAISAVPLCGCGDRGCGNIGIQLAKDIPAEDLFALVTLLRELPWENTAPTRSTVLTGDSVAALPA